jgi:membrane-associated phospholipid phosphatase
MKLNKKICEWKEHYTLIDFLFIAYMAFLSLLILFFHDGVGNWFIYEIFHIGVIAFIIFLVPSFNKSENGIKKFIRWWYPVLLFTFNYKEINAFTHIIVKTWQDNLILQFEKFIFGVHPTLWLENFVSPVVTELMKFNYFTYYLMIIVGASFLYFSGKRKHYIRYLSTVCLAFYISYIGFIIIPVRGPRYTLYDKYTKDYDITVSGYYGPFVAKDVASEKTKALKGYAFTNMQDYIMRYGSLHGGCMPSSHIAVALVCMLLMFKYKRKVFYFYLPMVTLLCVSVVYNRYHYVSDVAAGLLVGIFAFFATPYMHKGWDKFC